MIGASVAPRADAPALPWSSSYNRGVNRPQVILGAVGVVFLLSSAPLSAQALTIDFRTYPDTVFVGGDATVEVVVRNNGSTDVVNLSGEVQIHPSLEILSASAPSPWSVRIFSFLGEGLLFVYLGPATLARGSSVTLSIRLRVSDTRLWPGARLFVNASAASGSAGASNSTFVVIAGSAPLPTASSQLFRSGPDVTAIENARFSDVVYDPVAGSYVIAATRVTQVSGLYQPIVAVTTNTAATPLVTQQLETSLPLPNRPRLAYSADIAGGAGGALLVWYEGSDVYARTLTTQSLVAGSRTLISDGSATNSSPVVAYSSTSRVFLVVWVRGTTPSRIMARRVGLDAQPIGSAIDVGAGSLPDVAWNSVTNEFAIAWSSGFARLSTGGAILSRLESDVGRHIGVNRSTGAYVIVGSRDGGFFGAEVSPSGRVISRGLIGATMSNARARSIVFNPVSETFLVSNGAQTVELNGHGAPLSLPTTALSTATCAGDAMASRNDLGEWRLVNGPSSTINVCSLGIGTFSRNGGSDMRLGGCETPDPFEAFGGGHCYNGGWLPPGLEPLGVPLPIITSPSPTPSPTPPPAPGDCATPDPFVALGGGTCAGGGWYPPGMTLPTPPPPPGPGGCVTPDPFVAFGGGTCWNGGWLPPGMPVPTSRIDRVIR